MVANPHPPLKHLKSMPPQTVRYVCVFALAVGFSSFSACTRSDNPDQIRQRTADATATMRRDAKAVAEGVKEGMARDKTIDINKAARADLLTLPGITDHAADRILSDRPFGDTHELVTRHIIMQEEFDKIHDRIIAGH